MLAFDLLSVDFPDRVSSSGELAVIDPSRIRVEVHQAKGLEQPLQVDKDFIRSTPEYIH